MTKPWFRRAVLVLVLTLACPMAAEEPAAPPSSPRPLVTSPSPINAGCYAPAAGQCRIHVDPFSVNIIAGYRLLFFNLVATRLPSGIQTIIYAYKPDTTYGPSSPYTPSLVTQDFGAACGVMYSVSLIAQDQSDPSPKTIGASGNFTCPAGTLP